MTLDFGEQSIFLAKAMPSIRNYGSNMQNNTSLSFLVVLLAGLVLVGCQNENRESRARAELRKCLKSPTVKLVEKVVREVGIEPLLIAADKAEELRTPLLGLAYNDTNSDLNNAIMSRINDGRWSNPKQLSISFYTALLINKMNKGPASYSISSSSTLHKCLLFLHAVDESLPIFQRVESFDCGKIRPGLYALVRTDESGGEFAHKYYIQDDSIIGATKGDVRALKKYAIPSMESVVSIALVHEDDIIETFVLFLWPAKPK